MKKWPLFVGLFLFFITTIPHVYADNFPPSLDKYVNDAKRLADTSAISSAAQSLNNYRFDTKHNGFVAADEDEALAIASRLDQYETALRDFESRPVVIKGENHTIVAYAPPNPATFNQSMVRPTGGVYDMSAPSEGSSTNSGGVFNDIIEKDTKNEKNGPNKFTEMIIGFFGSIPIKLEQLLMLKDLVTLVFGDEHTSTEPLPSVLLGIIVLVFQTLRPITIAVSAIAIAWSGIKIMQAREKSSPSELNMALEGLYKTLGVSIVFTLLPEILRVLNLFVVSLTHVLASMITWITGYDPKTTNFHTILFGGPLTDWSTGEHVLNLATRGFAYLIVLFAIFFFDLIFTYIYTMRFIKIVSMLIMLPFRIVMFLVFPEKIQDLLDYIGEFLGTLLLPVIHGIGIFAFFIIWHNEKLMHLSPTGELMTIILSLAAFLKFGSEGAKLMGRFASGAGSLSRAGEQFGGQVAQVAGSMAGAATGAIAGGALSLGSKIMSAKTAGITGNIGGGGGIGGGGNIGGGGGGSLGGMDGFGMSPANFAGLDMDQAIPLPTDKDAPLMGKGDRFLHDNGPVPSFKNTSTQASGVTSAQGSTQQTSGVIGAQGSAQMTGRTGTQGSAQTVFKAQTSEQPTPAPHDKIPAQGNHFSETVSKVGTKTMEFAKKLGQKVVPSIVPLAQTMAHSLVISSFTGDVGYTHSLYRDYYYGQERKKLDHLRLQKLQEKQQEAGDKLE
ncbi:MAG: hypothetical protein BSOLF_0531 [Candidatus Carbobacillus altaicus]|uniref:Uncharacterized protein n=1 Tax=Candidatus Carbonibacillus altaicus TaxID=2163959 RepID=A0A2R6Y0Q2_9BACL|nr:MAG: hypothetical protein BSOLF_0531 [Candidatus Carbobacillus altaicus]